MSMNNAGGIDDSGMGGLDWDKPPTPGRLTKAERIRLAEKVMGWKGQGYNVNFFHPDENSSDGREEAWQLLEEWCGTGRVYLHERTADGSHMVELRDGNKRYFGVADSLPLAACRALLAAVGGRDG